MNFFTKQEKIQMQETNYMVTKGENWGRDKLGNWD